MATAKNDNLDTIDRIAIEAARCGLAVNAGYYRDQERCRRQSEEFARGVHQVTVGRNRYGWYVRPTTNLMDCGQGISPNFPTEAEAMAWAERHVAEDPGRRSVYVPPVVAETSEIRPFMGRSGGFVVAYTRSDGTGSQSPRFATEAEAVAFDRDYQERARGRQQERDEEAAAWALKAKSSR